VDGLAIWRRDKSIFDGRQYPAPISRSFADCALLHPPEFEYLKGEALGLDSAMWNREFPGAISHHAHEQADSGPVAKPKNLFSKRANLTPRYWREIALGYWTAFHSFQLGVVVLATNCNTIATSLASLKLRAEITKRFGWPVCNHAGRRATTAEVISAAP